jgi:isopentenyl diphosphate isomerase/L-lactate dehydrogenase-like FMN-dependent dehydrogenase
MSSPNFLPQTIEDFEREARKHLDASQINYIYSGSESQWTLNRNVAAYSRYLLRRRVLQGIENVDLETSYFEGRVKSELPFFPSSVNSEPIYRNAILDLLKVANSFSIPVFVSQLAIAHPLDPAELPKLVKQKTSSLIWQVYLQSQNLEQSYKYAKLAESWGYKALTITVDMELNVKLGNAVPVQTADHSFVNVTPKEIKKLKQLSSLPLIAKGVMTTEDAELAIESGADGIVVSNHGARALDHTASTLEVLPEIVRGLKSRKKTRCAEIFFDGGIRRGTDILTALALGAKGCLLGRPVLWALACDHENGVPQMMKILKNELERAATLCGVPKISKIDPTVVRKADF